MIKIIALDGGVWWVHLSACLVTYKERWTPDHYIEKFACMIYLPGGKCIDVAPSTVVSIEDRLRDAKHSDLPPAGWGFR